MKTKIIAAVMAGTTLLIAGTYLLFNQPSEHTPKLVIGMMSGWAPFMTISNTGTFEGFDVDVANELANRLGTRLEIRDVGNLASTLLALEQGSIDMAMSGLDITTARLEKLRMIPYTGLAIRSFFLLFKDTVPTGIRSMADVTRIANAVICVEPGSAQEKFLDQTPAIEQKSLSKLEEMVLDVMYGKSTAMLVEPAVARRLMKQTPDLKPLEIPLPKEFQTMGMGIAFKKSNPVLATRVERAIKAMRTDGTLGRLERRWNLEEPA